MADSTTPGAVIALPEVDLNVRHGGRTASYTISHVDFLIGTVPGCDLRVPGTDLPPVLCLLARRPGGLALRKLAPTQLLLVNGATTTQADLQDGDRVTLGAMDLFVRIRASEVPATADPGPPLARGGDDGPDRQELAKQQAELDAGALDLEKQRQELAGMRQELADIRRQLYERYQERRDRLSGLQEAVDRAAKKVQERKRALDAEEQQSQKRRQEDLSRQTELDRRAADLTAQAKRLEEERRLFQESQAEVQADLTRKLEDLQSREIKLADERRDLEGKLRPYQSDVLRLDRLQGALDERDKQLQEDRQAFEEKVAQLQRDSAELEEQIAEMDQVRAYQQEEAKRLAKQKEAQDAADHELAQRSAAIEGQQATLAALRTRLERTREEVRRQEQQLDEERARQEADRADVEKQRQDLVLLQAQLEGEQKLRDQERRQLLEKSALLDAAVSQLRQAQDKLADNEKGLLERSHDLDRGFDALAAKESALQGRLQQLAESQEQLDSERQTLRERTQAQAQAELARAALQEQLRRRAEELGARQKTLSDKIVEHEAQVAGLESRRAEIELLYQEGQTQLDTWRQELAGVAESLQKQQADLLERETHRRRQFEQVQQLGREVAAQRKALAEEQATARQERLAAEEAQARRQAEFLAARQEAVELTRQLPDVELRAGTALERLTHAREQLRDHLTALHAFVQECREDLEGHQARLQRDQAGLRDQEQTLRRNQEEHRLAMVAFRQQMIGWQGQIADLKRLLASDATRLDRRQALVEEQAKEVGATSEKLAQKAEVLEQREQEVAGKRQEMDRHLIDMRQWYRKKLRELAGIHSDQVVAEETEAAEDGVVSLPARAPDNEPYAIAGADQLEEEDGEPPLVPIPRNILSMTGPVDPGDRRLGDTLIGLELIDKDTLTALLVEARRQRRSLRQVLLAGGTVTLYQLALIEAGNVDGLMLGPVRIIDRLRVARQETVYRVFDPRRGQEAVLRHLSEEAMGDAVRPDEFRQRFSQAVLAEPRLAGTLEVLDIAGRPAALQEWLAGLPACDWPPLAAAPGVCFRLFTQTALALDALHKAGLVHGYLTDGCIFLTSDSTLKISGIGEPPWLLGGFAEETTDPRADLRALGRIVSGWCTPTGVRKGPKTKPLPDALVAVLYRLTGEGDAGYQSAGELLQGLDEAGRDVPPNPEAWERLLRYVREHATPEAVLRQSA